ncbi:MAG: AAA family ATPase [bacterium]|nr:AAA family ATPase [bacterium]
MGELSRGMKQKLTLTKTLLSEPEILLLDEPASGLDPVARKELSDILKSLSTQEITIIISSHILTELSDFCISVGIMENGKMG